MTEHKYGPKGHIVDDAVNEIQGSDIIRERKQQFFFLHMFGFADEQAVLNILKDK